MNKIELGRTLEKKVNGWLKAAGWTTKLVEPKKVFIPDKKEKNNPLDPGNRKKKKARAGFWISKDQDIWGADILAIKVDNLNLAIQVTADSGLGRKAQEFAKYPYNSTWLCLIFQAKKKSGKWVFLVYEARDGEYFPVCPEKLESIFGKAWPKEKVITEAKDEA